MHFNKHLWALKRINKYWTRFIARELRGFSFFSGCLRGSHKLENFICIDLKATGNVVYAIYREQWLFSGKIKWIFASYWCILNWIIIEKTCFLCIVHNVYGVKVPRIRTKHSNVHEVRTLIQKASIHMCSKPVKCAFVPEFFVILDFAWLFIICMIFSLSHTESNVIDL